jgi:hypothetical protein
MERVPSVDRRNLRGDNQITCGGNLRFSGMTNA